MRTNLKKYKIGSVELQNPIVVASSPATEDFERLLRCADAGAGAAILKSCHTVGLTLSRQRSRQFQVTERGLWGTSTAARELLHPEMACSIMDDIATRSDFTVIPSVAGFSLDSSEWLDTLQLFKPFNPACIQLDLFYLKEDISLPATQNRLRELMLYLKTKCDLRLLPKLNQEFRPGAAIEVFNKTGITGWSVLDSVRTNLPRNTSLHLSAFPEFNFEEGRTSASLFGPWQLPLVCEYVFRLKTASDIPILAGGGVRNAADIMQLLSLGADAVQVATSIIHDGPDWIRRTIVELRGYAVVEHEQTPAPQKSKNAQVQFDRSLCSSCGRCSVHLMCTAIEIGANGPSVVPEKCEGCSFCLNLCPEKAISFSDEQTQDYTKISSNY